MIQYDGFVLLKKDTDNVKPNIFIKQPIFADVYCRQFDNLLLFRYSDRLFSSTMGVTGSGFDLYKNEISFIFGYYIKFSIFFPVIPDNNGEIVTFEIICGYILSLLTDVFCLPKQIVLPR